MIGAFIAVLAVLAAIATYCDQYMLAIILTLVAIIAIYL